MNMREVKGLETGTKGVEITGEITRIFPTKVRTNPISKHKETNQFVLVSDGTTTVGVNLVNIKVDDTFVGKDITVKNGSVRTYEDAKGKEQMVLDVISPGASIITPEASTVSHDVEEIQLDKPERKPSDQVLSELLGKAADLLTTAPAVGMLKLVKDAGWTSEDLRSVMISMFIEARRN